MAFEKIEDLMGLGGESYFLDDKKDLTQIPPEILEIASPRLLRIFQELPHRILETAEQAKQKLPEIPKLYEWLKSLSSAPTRLEIHSPAYVSQVAYLRFMVEEKWTPAITFANRPFTRDYFYPDMITRLFSLLGEINHNGFMHAGGLIYPDYNGHLATSRRHFTQDIYTFYMTFTGDYLGYNDEEKTFWYFHELDDLRPYKPLNHALNEYFETLLNNKELWGKF